MTCVDLFHKAQVGGRLLVSPHFDLVDQAIDDVLLNFEGQVEMGIGYGPSDFLACFLVPLGLLAHPLVKVDDILEALFRDGDIDE